jgi:hypothetical protein
VPSDVGLHFGLRATYGIPFATAKASALSDLVGGAFSFGAELGWFFNPHLFVGGSFQYGLGLDSSSANAPCPVSPDDSCSESLVRFGVTTRWHFRPKESIDPWVGAGLGYEILNLSENDSSGSPIESHAIQGFDLSLQTGVDYKPKPFYGVGPFVEGSFGHYWYNPFTVHGWFALGVRLHSGT